MGVPLIYELYPSKPLESWDKAAELRRKLFWDIWHGKEEGKHDGDPSTGSEEGHLILNEAERGGKQHAHDCRAEQSDGDPCQIPECLRGNPQKQLQTDMTPLAQCQRSTHQRDPQHPGRGQFQ